jgi:hypothetical protein
MTEQEDPLDDMDVQHIKLSDGIELVGYINSTEGAMILVERPMTINLVQTTNGYDTYFFTKYMPFAKHNIVKLNSRNVIAASEVRNEIKEKYIQAALKTEIAEEEEKLDSEMDLASDEDMDLNFMEPASKKVH